jgi:hypothetical protein
MSDRLKSLIVSEFEHFKEIDSLELSRRMGENHGDIVGENYTQNE